MKRIAVIIEGSLTNRKGQINASLSRIKHLKAIDDFDVDVFCLDSKPSWLFGLLKRSKKEPNRTEQIVDGITVHLLKTTWYFIDYLLYVKLGLSKLLAKNELNQYVDLFQDFDLLSAHSNQPAFLAQKVFEKHHHPYCVTWHGSDIHSIPFHNRYVRRETEKCLLSAKYNFFVSEALLKCSKKLVDCQNGMVLHNGVDERFYPYDENDLKSVKVKYGVGGKKVVAFVGNLIEIKNVMVLPEIFKLVQEGYHGEVAFWIIGGGKLESDLRSRLRTEGVVCRMFGNQPIEMMPDLMNCIDVLVLPSLNEGLPLVTLEALACHANVVGSDVGGIPESIGKDSVIPLGVEFNQLCAQKVIDYLETPRKQGDLSSFNWNVVAKIESDIYHSIFEGV